MSKDKEVINSSDLLLTNDYALWRKDIETLIDMAKLKAAINVNMELLSLYWKIGRQILDKQEKRGWGRQVIEQLSKDLASRYPDDRGYSKRNLGYMKSFAMQYPAFPFFASSTCKIKEFANFAGYTCQIGE